MSRTKSYGILIGLAFLLTSSAFPADVGPTYAVLNCRIVPVVGPAVEKGVVIIRNGLIESYGPAGRVEIPPDAEPVEAEGWTAYPGFIDAHTSHFLETSREEADSSRAAAAQTSGETRTGFNPQLEAFDSLKPKISKIQALQRVGFTTVLVAPEKGIFAGQSVLLNLNGDQPGRMVLGNPVALHLNFVTERNVYPSSLMGTMAVLRQSFLDAEHYSVRKDIWKRIPRGTPRAEYDPFLEALLPYVVDKKPVVFTCTNQEDIKRAVGLAEEFKLRVILSGANEAWRVAELVKNSKLPLLVSLKFTPPMASLYSVQGEEAKKKAEADLYPANAARLHKAGVAFALTSNGLTKESDVMKNIQAAVKAGLPAEEALRALTIHPARFLGVDSVLGSLEPGKIANIILGSGEIFSETFSVERVFVDGVLFKVEKPPKDQPPASLNITGKWRGTLTSPMGDLEVTAEFEQSGNRVTGSLTSSFGKWDFGDGLLSQNELKFTVRAPIMGESVDIQFSGRADKDLVQGTMEFSQGKAEVTLTRVPDLSEEGERS